MGIEVSVVRVFTDENGKHGNPLGIVDAFVIITGRNERNVQAIADEIEEKLQEVGVEARRREGKTLSRWIMLDFGDLAVHVMHEEERTYYTHERLFGGCPTIQLDITD